MRFFCNPFYLIYVRFEKFGTLQIHIPMGENNEESRDNEAN